MKSNNTKSRSTEKKEMLRDMLAGGLVEPWFSSEVPRQNKSEVFEALDKLKSGTYGICVDCGKKIPESRLKAKPEAIRCIDCQILVEEQYVSTMGIGSHVVGSSFLHDDPIY